MAIPMSRDLPSSRRYGSRHERTTRFRRAASTQAGSCQSRCQSTSQHQTGLWRSSWIWRLT
jgi:hypothetical protein